MITIIQLIQIKMPLFQKTIENTYSRIWQKHIKFRNRTLILVEKLMRLVIFIYPNPSISKILDDIQEMKTKVENYKSDVET